MSESVTGPADVPEPSIHDQIRALLPGHTHEKVLGAFFGDTVWTWTTPLGTWTVSLAVHVGPLGVRVLAFSGPGGEWTFAWPDDRGIRQLATVLRALDAIEGDDDA